MVVMAAFDEEAVDPNHLHALVQKLSDPDLHLEVHTPSNETGCWDCWWSLLTQARPGDKMQYMGILRAASRMLNIQSFRLQISEDEPSALKRLESMSVHEASAVDKCGRNALHVAAAAGHPRACQLLLNLGKNDCSWCGTADHEGWTALHWAAEYGQAECCEVLLTSPFFDAEAHRDKRGRTALHVAALAGRAAVCEMLLNCVQLENPILRRGSLTKLAGAASRRTGVLSGLAPWAFTPIDDPDSSGLTALHLAADAGDAECIQAMCSNPRHSVNVSAPDSLGHTALHRAAASGHVKACQALLSSRLGSTVANKVDKHKNTALHTAAMYGQKEVVKALLRSSNFTSANAQNDYGRTALHEAAIQGDVMTSNTIARTRARGMLGDYAPFTAFSARDEQGRTALHLAVSGGHVALVQAMLDTLLPNSALILTDRDGRTALHYAALAGNSAIFQAILEDHYFSAVEQEDCDGNTAVALATGDVSRLIQSMYSLKGERMEEAKVIAGTFV